MRAFKDVIESLAAAIKDSSINLEEVPTKNRAGMGIRKNDAITSIASLKEEYRTILGPRVAAIWLHGTDEQQAEFSHVAATEGETLTVSTLSAYEKMAADIEPTVGYERQFGGTQLGHLLRSLEAVAKEAGATFLATPKLMDVITVQDLKSLTLAIKDIIVTQVGEKLNIMYMEEKALEQALDAEFCEKVVPIVVITSGVETETLRYGFFSGRGIDFLIPQGATPDKAMVLTAFAALQKHIKKSPTKESETVGAVTTPQEAIVTKELDTNKIP